MTADRSLTARQETALRLCAVDFVSRSSSGSMASLERRGLVRRVERRTTSGLPYRTWELTDAGREVVAALPEAEF
jgi:chromosome segregation and condensation protein ScpB